MLFMVIEHFRNGDPAPVYARFREKGRLAPRGLEYVGSAVTQDLTTCYQLMECDDRATLDTWMNMWADLIYFEVIPVIHSGEAAALVAAKSSATDKPAVTRDPGEVDALFQNAVAAIDAGDIAALEHMLAQHPNLLRDRLDAPGQWLREKVGGAIDGFFERPYLLWFVAEDPVRNGKLPKNIAQVTRVIIEAAQREGVHSLKEQLDYALKLVSWSWIARDCGVQIELIDVLVDAGAAPDGISNDALVNRNYTAAERLLERGAPLTLPTALCLERWDDVARLIPVTNSRQKQFGFVLSALNGKAEALRRMLNAGVELNSPSTDLYSHATPVHHAVCSGSLEAVRVLVDAGAKLNTKDTAWDATPLGWAEYYMKQHEGDEKSSRYSEIGDYLRQRGAHRE